MSNIRFVRQPDKKSKGCLLDCFVLPSDVAWGELIHYHPNKVIHLPEKKHHGMFSAMNGFLDCIPAGEAIPKIEVRLVLSRLRNGQRSYYFLKSANQYSVSSPEGDLWLLIEAVLKERLKEIQM